MPKYGCFLIFLQIYLATVLVSQFSDIEANGRQPYPFRHCSKLISGWYRLPVIDPGVRAVAQRPWQAPSDG